MWHFAGGFLCHVTGSYDVAKSRSRILVEALTDPEVEALINKNLKLAYWYANRYANQWNLDPDDAAQEAIQALVKAAMSFDPEKKKDFAPLASRYIENALRHMASPQVVAYKAGKKGRRLGRVDLDAPFGEEGEDVAHDIVGSEDPEHQAVIDKDTYDLMRSEIEKLSDREQKIIELWSKGQNYRDIAKVMGISHMHVGNLLKKALDRLRSVMQSA